MKMKTPLSFYGGKQRIAKRIVDMMPAHSAYCEPFAGGLAVLFAKGLPMLTNADNYREVVNDIDGEIVNFWRELQDPNSPFHHRIKWTPFSLQEHTAATKENSAWGTWVRRMQGFGNKPSAGWARNITKSGPALCSYPAVFMNAVARMPECAERFRGAYIECRDATDVIKTWDSPYTLHYCDPPYPGTDMKAYGSDYSLSDLQRLVDTLADCKGSIILSNYEQLGLIVPDDWQKIEIDSYVSVGNTSDKGKEKKRKEILWICDRSRNAPSEHWPKMWSPSKGYEWF
jgi:DNA adenine methylase